MAVRGFRLYKLEVAPGSKRSRIPLGGEHISDLMLKRLNTDLERLRGTVFVGAPKTGPDEPIPEKIAAGTTVMRVDSVTQHGATFEIVVAYGRTGEHELALSAEGDADIVLERLAVSNRFRVHLYMPTEGNVGLMASEVIGRSHVSDVFLRRLTAENERAYYLEGKKHPWLRWVHSKLFDASRIREIAAADYVTGISLKRSKRGADGERSTQGLTLQQNGIPASKRAKVAEILNRWVLKSLKKYSGSVSEVDEMIDLVDGDVRDLGFDDGEIHFQEDGKQQSISPSNLEKIFTYPLQEGQIVGSAYRAEVERRIHQVVIDQEIPLDL